MPPKAAALAPPERIVVFLRPNSCAVSVATTSCRVDIIGSLPVFQTMQKTVRSDCQPAREIAPGAILPSSRCDQQPFKRSGHLGIVPGHYVRSDLED
jgi:hypothetical protein